MRTLLPAAALFGLALALLGWVENAQARRPEPRQYYDKTWTHDKDKNYYYKTFHYKAKATDKEYRKQYVIYKPSVTKNFVHWYNPDTKKYWARCPTVNHPDYGKEVKRGKDYWSIASQDQRYDTLDKMKEENYGRIEEKSPPIPYSEDNVKIQCPPSDLPRA